MRHINRLRRILRPTKQILLQHWQAIPEAHRTVEQFHVFQALAWEAGLRMGDTPAAHYLATMNVLRNAILVGWGNNAIGLDRETRRPPARS